MYLTMSSTMYPIMAYLQFLINMHRFGILLTMHTHVHR